MACCRCNGEQAQVADMVAASFGASAPSPIVRTGRQYVGGASGFDSPFDTPSPILTAIPRAVQARAGFPVMIVIPLVAVVLYLYLQKKGVS